MKAAPLVAPSVPLLNMPSFDKSADIAIGSDSLRCSKKFAHKFKLNTDVKESGLKSEAADYNIWRLQIHSDSAYSLNVIFEQFNIPDGAKLFLYTPNKEQILGAFTKQNCTGGKFAVAPLDGEDIVIEYEEPKNAEFNGVLKLASVNHDYVGLRALPTYGKAEACEVEASSDTIHLNQRQSACLLLIDGEMYCSGNLINNTRGDGAPYVLSSSHCLFDDNNEVDTSKAQTTVFFFNYASPTPDWNIAGSREMSLSGSHTAAYRQNRDMLLLKLNEVPPVDYRPYFVGWNHESSVSGPVYDFHHPSGDVMKVSYDDADPAAKSFTCNGLFLKDGHWMVYRWDEGITEGGSSGSGLFDANDRVVGALTGGDTELSCSKPGYDDFWRLSVAWSDASKSINNLKSCLDPDGTGSYRIDGLQPYKNPCIRYTNRKLTDVPSEGSTSYGYPVGNNKLGVTAYAEHFTPGYESTLYGVYFYPENSYYAASTPVYLQIYSGDSVPDSLLYQQELRVQNAIYNREYGQFANAVVRQWSGIENYLRLNEPVKVDSSFFVVYSIGNYTRRDSFALCHTAGRTDTTMVNTAFYKDSKGRWLPFTTHPAVKAPMTIMTDAVLRQGWNNVDSVYVQPPVINPEEEKKSETDDDSYLMTPSPTTGTVYLIAPDYEVLSAFQIVDCNGRTCYRKTGMSETGTYTFDVSKYTHEGVYIIKANYKYTTKYYKFIRQIK